MKKLILTLLLLLSFGSASAQLGSETFSLQYGESTLPEYDLDAIAFWSSWSSEPADTMKQKLSTFYTMLKDSLVYDSIQYMYGPFGTANDSQFEMKNPAAFKWSLVNSPTFTAYEGFQGNGTSSYISTGINLSTDGGIYDVNSGGIYIYCRTNSTNAGNIFGAQTSGDPVNALKMFIRYTDNNFYADINDAGTSPLVFSNTDSRGGFAITRPEENNMHYYKNGALTDTEANSSTNIPNLIVYLLCRNNAGSPALYNGAHQLSWFIVGSGWSTTTVRKIHNCVQWYMNSNGKGV